MTYEDVQRQNADKLARRLPWPDQPGEFMIQLVPSGLEDPEVLNCPGILTAIALARIKWEDHKRTGARLRVTRDDGSEVFFGSL